MVDALVSVGRKDVTSGRVSLDREAHDRETTLNLDTIGFVNSVCSVHAVDAQ